MKLFLNTVLFFFIIFLYGNSTYSLSAYQIKKECQNKPKRTTCIKNLRLKQLNLLQGGIIEIPVIPLKK